MERSLSLASAWSIALALCAPLDLRAQFGPTTYIEDPDAIALSSVLAHDLDSDGDQDVLITSWLDDVVAWYENLGGGTFGPRQRITTSVTWPRSAVMIDADEDGDPDIITANGSGSNAKLVWIPYEADQLYGPEQTIATQAWGTRQVLGADIDQDGLQDIVTCGATGGNSRVSWFSNLPVGGFGPRQVLSTVDRPFACVAVADLNGDDLPDVLAGTETGYLLWYRNIGDGTFAPEAQIWQYSDWDVSSMLGMDMDGDGDTDVMFSDRYSNSVSWFRNDGSGGFTQGGGVPSTWDEPYSLHAHDMDQDGIDDILFAAAASDELIWVPVNGDGTMGSPARIDQASGGAVSVTVADLDGDGLKDVLAVSERDGDIAWYHADGDGTFSARPLIDRQVLQPNTCLFRDLDQDGLTDILVSSTSDSKISMHRGLGDGAFGPQEVISREAHTNRTSIAEDMDGDGDVDVVSIVDWGIPYDEVALFRNDGSGHFDDAEVILQQSGVGWEMVAGDMDNDNDIDLVACAPGFERVAWYENDGSGLLGPMHPVAPEVGATIVQVGDLNGDGLLDVICASGAGGRLFWFRNEGGGSFSAEIELDASAGAVSTIVPADLDADGSVDLLCTLPDDDLVTWYRNNGDGTFTGPSTIIAGLNSVNGVRGGDLDGDGEMDVVACGEFADLLVWSRNLGNGTFASAEVISSTLSSPRGPELEDLDGDGRMDVVCLEDWAVVWFRSFINSPYRIEGQVFFDGDEDGTYGPGDAVMPWVQVGSTPYTSAPMTGAMGAYTIYADTGTYLLDAPLPNTLWTYTTGASEHTVHLTAAAPIATGIDFGYAPAVDTSIIVPSLSSAPVMCGGRTHLWVSYANQGTRVESGTITLELDPLYGYVSATPAPDQVVGNVLTWSFDTLSYFEVRSIDVVADWPDVASIGALLTSTLTIVALEQGVPAATFSVQDLQGVFCAYDPNDKRVIPAGYGAPGAIDIGTRHLDYTVRFQNTGTAPAQNVMLRDRLASVFDPTSLQVLGFSHVPTDVRIENNEELVVHFDGIMLPDSGTDPLASQGFITFRLGLLDGLPHLTPIQNAVDIFFDVNPPITTAPTRNTLVDCALWAPQINVPTTGTLEATHGDAYQWFLDGEPLPGDTNALLFTSGIGTYTVHVTSPYGCQALSDPYVILVTDVGLVPAARFAILPNPFTTTARLLSNEVLTPDHRIELIDLHGRVLRTQIGNGSREVVLERSGLVQGLYVVRISHGGTPVGNARVVVE